MAGMENLGRFQLDTRATCAVQWLCCRRLWASIPRRRVDLQHMRNVFLSFPVYSWSKPVTFWHLDISWYILIYCILIILTPGQRTLHRRGPGIGSCCTKWNISCCTMWWANSAWCQVAGAVPESRTMALLREARSAQSTDQVRCWGREGPPLHSLNIFETRCLNGDWNKSYHYKVL